MTTVGQMTKEELRELIEASIEQKLLEIFGDPEGDLELKDSIRKQLLRQKEAVAAGERGADLKDIAYRLNLD